MEQEGQLCGHLEDRTGWAGGQPLSSKMLGLQPGPGSLPSRPRVASGASVLGSSSASSLPARQLPPHCPGRGRAAGGSCHFRITEPGWVQGGRQSCHSLVRSPFSPSSCSAYPTDAAAGEWASAWGGLPRSRPARVSTQDTSVASELPGRLWALHWQGHRPSRDAPAGAAAVPSCPLSARGAGG